MSSCTNNIEASNSTDTTTLDDISRGIEKVTIADNTVDVSRYDMSGTRLEEMSNKKCISCEQKLKHTKTDITSSNDDNAGQDIVDIVQDNAGINLEASGILCANCGKESASNTCNKCKMAKYCNAACKKRRIDLSIRKIVRSMSNDWLNCRKKKINVLLSYMILNSSNNHRSKKEIVLYAS